MDSITYASSADELSTPRRRSGPADNVYGWSDKLQEGSRGEAVVKQWLRDNGYFVTDVSDNLVWQKRDIDFIIEGVTAEVKTDRYPARNLAIELTSNGRPGCLFKSRAESWLYYFEREHKLLWMSLPHLQWFVTGRLYKRASYRHYNVYTQAGGRTWAAQGILIPLDDLRTSGALWLEETI